MATQIVRTKSDDVKVMHLPTRTVYYRGHYYRIVTTLCVTPRNFRSFNRATFFGHSTGLRWFYTENGSDRSMHSRIYDSSHMTDEAPF